jgi:hypothetical protein
MPWHEKPLSTRVLSAMTRSAAILLLPLTPLAAAPDFEREVAPILEARCLSCHDAANAKGDVRLDTQAAVLEHLKPGHPNASLLIEQISGPEPDMPKKEKPLTPTQVEMLRQWVQSGAPWPEGRILADKPARDLDWWSLRKLRNDEFRMTNGNPVDHFIEAKLAEKGLAPVPEADPATLIRRLSYDLTGLPPGSIDPSDLSDLPNLSDPQSYTTFVDHLLASPAFGEKWAQHWLDLVRYAETHGYDKDKPRMNAWPYRDYVIRSLNDDKPYDLFIQEQIAGDALFPGKPDGITALGFLAAGPWDFIGHKEVGEGKVDGRIAKHLDRDEMISAVFNAFTSTTVQCAQCHHHKFDPVTMTDYYRLHAVFAAVDRADRVFTGLPPEKEKERNAIAAEISTLQKERDKLDTGVKRAIAARASGIDRRIAELTDKHGAPLLPQYGYHSHISKTQDSAKWVQLDLGQARALSHAVIYPAYDTFNDIGAGFGFPVRWKLEASDDPKFESGVRLLHDATQADQPNPAHREIRVDIGGAPVRHLRLTATKLAPRKNDFMLALGEIEIIGEDQENHARSAQVSSLDSIEQSQRWRMANLVDGIYHRELRDPAALGELRQLQDQRAAIEAELRTPETTQRLDEIQTRLAALNEQLKTFPKGELVYAAATDFTADGRFIATAGKPREIRLLNRGDIRAPGDLMQPGMPPLWPGAPERFNLPPDAPESAARAELAKAITARDNPLFWRSIVNRLWLWTFGQGLVGSPNDFGRMGMDPTHPELLDHLAATLRDDPEHSLKNIIRLLVTSRAYRRASTHHEANAAIDADNASLWRANRRRLSAEEYRDSLLAVSGVLRLEERGGGPSFQDFVIEKPQHSPHYQYHLHDPRDTAAHRRSIYRFIVRSQPQPFLTTLDCADPSQSVPQRDESTTALQALAQWNNRLVEAMSDTLGRRLAKENDPVTAAFQAALTRPPTPDEHATLSAHLQKHGPAALARVLFNLNAFLYLD